MPENPYASIAIKDDNPYKAIAASEVNGPAVSQAAPEPGMLDPHGGAFDLLRGGINSLLQPIMHPIQTAESGGKPFALTSPEDYPSTSPLGFGEKGAEAQKAAEGQYQENAQDQGKFAREHPAYTAGAIAAPLIAGVGMKGLSDLVPTGAGAGELFNQVMEKAGDKPVNLSRSLKPMERAQQLSGSGHGTVSAIDNLYKRINTVNPLDYREARDWASALSNITGEDQMRASKSLKAQAKMLSKSLNQDIGDTASSVGMGDQYTKAMRDYARASQLRDLVSKVGKVAVPAAAGAAGAGIGYRLLKPFFSER